MRMRCHAPMRCTNSVRNQRVGFHHVRSISSSKSNVDLKKHLRKFYRRVHPDLFSAKPAEKLVNEASFKLLMSMIQESEAAPAHSTSTQFRLEFYVMPSLQSGGSSSSSCPLISVDVNFTGDSSLASRKATVRSVLHSLLTQSGLLKEGEKKGGEEGEAIISEEDEFRERLKRARQIQGDDIIAEPESLAHFIHTYASVARERREAHAALDREVGLLRSMLVISFQVRVAYDLGPTPPPLEEQAALIAQLHDAIAAAASAAVTGSTVCLSSSARDPPIDEAGRIVLPFHAPDQWTSILKTVDSTMLLQSKQRYEEILSREKACAAALGLGTVFAESFKFSIAPEYHRFLVRVQNGSEKDVFQHLNRNLYGRLSLKAIQMTLGEALPTIDPSSGFSIPHDISTGELAQFLKEHSAEAVRGFKQWDLDRRRDDDLLRYVRRQLMAHGIRRDEAVTPQQMRATLSRLRGQEAVLGQQLRGVDLRVGTLYRVWADGTMEVPWDWNKH